MALELVRLPPIGKLVKVVQLYIDDLPVLRTSDVDDKHRLILADALDEFGIPYKTKRLLSGSGPELTGERYNTVGMGMCSRTEKEVTFFDYSLDYGLGISREHAADISKHVTGVAFKYI
jgi:hypothetical protein